MRRGTKTILHGNVVIEGAGVRLRRMFGYADVPAFDPFLMLDDFRSDTPADYLNGFPWHPHRGIETITYVLRGHVEHGDSMGNRGAISSGDVQWMTAGSGIIHQEMPQGDPQGSMHGFQLWANLPARQKMIPPRYRSITAGRIPVAELPGGVRVKVIAGTVNGVRGPMEEIAIDPEYLECAVPPGVAFTHPTRRGYTAVLYVIGGTGLVNDAPVRNHDLVLFEDGDELALEATGEAGDEPLRFLLLTGKPLGEPVAWHGPIVMNTEEELQKTFEELQQGTFLKQG
ncbi:MAG: pirin family protein [Humidesulfovibrio sp.]|nr:pirin family protein [Humidesulfovibrio sp.]